VNVFKIVQAKKALESWVRDTAQEWIKQITPDYVTDERWRAVWHEDGTVAVEVDGAEIARFRLGIVALRVDQDPQIVEIYNEHILIGDQLQGKSGAWFPVEEVRFTSSGDVVVFLDVKGKRVRTTRDAYVKSKVKRGPTGVAADMIMNEFPNTTIDREDEDTPPW
jgi:hypothetical protein